MENQIFFLHLSDTHLTFAKPHSPICCTPQELEAAYAYAAALDCPPQFVLITGDFVHEGNASDYQSAKALVEHLDSTYRVKTHVALGNHDRHAAFWAGYCAKPQTVGRYYYQTQQSGIRLLVLDSATDDIVFGNLDAEQLAWLKQQLCKPCPLPTVVALHHPPCGTPVCQTNQNNLRQPQAFLELLAEHPVQAVLCGHKHFASTTTAPGGTPVYTASGLAFGIELPRGGSLRFVKGAQLQYAAVCDGRFYWSLLDLSEKALLAEMTPEQMLHFHRK